MEYRKAESYRLAGSWRRYRALIVSVSFAYVLGVSEYFHWSQWYSGHISDLYAYQDELLEGHAPWLVDQSRVLAPLIIALIQRIAHLSYEDAYQNFMFWSFIGINFSTAILFRSLGLTVGQSLIGLLLAAAVPMLLLNWWWFPWTNLEAFLWILLFTVDALGWRGRRQFAAVAVIFTAMVFTKETAVFVPVWIVIRALTEPQRSWSHAARICAMGFSMVLLSLFIDHELRRTLWVSGTFPGLPLGYPPDAEVLGGTMPNMYLWPRATIDYYLLNAAALFTGRIPWPLSDNHHWTDSASGSIDFFAILAMSILGAFWSWRRREPVILALSLLSLSYLAVCVVMINMPESDKLLPTLAFGIYAYARWCAVDLRSLRVLTAKGKLPSRSVNVPAVADRRLRVVQRGPSPKGGGWTPPLTSARRRHSRLREMTEPCPLPAPLAGC